MKWTSENGKDVELVDCMGTRVPNVLSWDDDTETAVICLSGHNSRMDRTLAVCHPIVADLSNCHPIGKFKLLQIEVKIPGAKLKERSK